MNNFENEYKNYAKDSAPNLWDRIEAGVDAYEAANVQAVGAQSDTESDNRVIKKNFRKKYLPLCGGLAAAVALIVIVVPVMKNPTVMSSRDTMSAEAPAAAEASYVAEEAPAAAEVFEAEVAEESYADEAAGAYEEAAESESAAGGSDLAVQDGENLREKSAAMKIKNEAIVSVSWEESENVTDCAVVAIDEDENSKVRIHFDEDVTDFELMKINITDVSEDGKLIYDGYDLFNSEKLYAGEDLVFCLTIPGDIPNHAISFKDASGQTRVYTISESGKDGSIVLAEQ